MKDFICKLIAYLITFVFLTVMYNLIAEFFGFTQIPIYIGIAIGFLINVTKNILTK